MSEHLDDIKEVEEKPKSPNYMPKGKSGTLVTAFQVEDDYISELLGTEGQIQYEKMERSDSQIRKLMHAVNNPIKSASWSIEPADDSEEQMKAAKIMNQIFFKDLDEGWISKLDEILDFPWRGHSVFEVVHKNYNKKSTGPYTGLAAIAYRDQKTLDEWHFDSKTGKLLKVHQLQQGEIPVNAFMDAENLLIFFNERKGDNLGFPFLRMLYGNYKRKLLYKQLQAIGIERAAIPVPHLELPDGVPHDSDEAANAESQLAAFTQAETAYFMTPHGYKLNYNTTGTFDPAKVQVAIKSENEEIAGSLVAMWLEMGIGGNSGNQAGTAISAEFFRDGIEYIADKIRDKINRLIEELCIMNFGEMDNYPTIEHNGIADEAGKELMEIVTGYTKAQVITPDEQLEDHVRKVHNLPKKMAGEEVEQGGTNDMGNDDEPDDDPTPPPIEPEEEVELNTKKKQNPVTLINNQRDVVAGIINDSLTFSAGKYINDVMARYRQLSESRKQSATSKVTMGGQNKFKKDLRVALTDTFFKSVDQVKLEIPSKKDVQLSTKDTDMKRLKFTGEEIKLNEKSKLPTHVQILLAKQAELISEDSIQDLKKRIDFSFSSIETKVSDENIIRQSMEEEADKFIGSAQVDVKATNVVALTVSEARNTFYFDSEVIDEIHSFTFVNFAPKSDICTALAGKTFAVNDAESMRYSPPLHHNCKSYIRANLKESRGVDKLEITTLSPTAEQKKSITL